MDHGCFICREINGETEQDHPLDLCLSCHNHSIVTFPMALDMLKGMIETEGRLHSNYVEPEERDLEDLDFDGLLFENEEDFE